MAQSYHTHKLSLTSIVAIMLSMTAAQNASAQNASAQNVSGTNRGTQGHGGQNRGTQGRNGQTGCCTNQSAGAVDPGVRGGTRGAGGPVGGLTSAEMAFFTAAQAQFEAVLGVPAGIGPGFNELSCGNCHISPRGRRFEPHDQSAGNRCEHGWRHKRDTVLHHREWSNTGGALCEQPGRNT
jgi:hypothetical protein